MADYKDLLLSHDFQSYRKRELVVMALHIHSLLKDGMYGDLDAQELKGALRLAAKIISLPLELTEDKNFKEELNRQIESELIGLTTSLVRQSVDLG